MLPAGKLHVARGAALRVQRQAGVHVGDDDPQIRDILPVVPCHPGG